MRILALSTWYPYPPDNGSKIRAHYLLKALHQYHDVTVAAFCPSHEVDCARQAADAAHLNVQPVYDDPFRHATAAQWLKFASPIPVIYWPSRAMQQATAELAARETWDAIVAIQTPVAPYALAFKSTPKVLDIDTALSFQMRERHEQRPNSLRSLRTWLSWQKAHVYEQRLFRHFQACTLVADSERPYMQSIVDSTPCEIVVVPNGVDCGHNRPGLFARQPNSLVYNGALTYYANFDAVQYFLKEIYPLIHHQTPEVSFTVTGSTQGVDRSGLQLDDSVTLSGYVDDIRAVVGGSAICVVPLRQGSGTRLKILEAMALGTPIVSTSKGAEGLDVRHDEHLLLADDAPTFAQHTLALLRDPALGQRLSAQARKLVEQHYDWSFIGDHFRRLVEDVAHRHTP
ncbi:MAG: glycosyltransferase [Chloroflexi bacterium]|nr:glycosyltransferase [Chloroflexota bacterium]